MIDSVVFHRIEGFEFATSLGLASSQSAFLRYMDEEPVFRDLVAHLQAQPQDSETIFSRLQGLARTAIDTRYRHPNDTALAAYLRCLDLIGSPYVAPAADLVTEARNTWWSRKVASAVAERRTNSSSSEVFSVVGFPNPLITMGPLTPYNLVGEWTPATAIRCGYPEINHVRTEISTIAISGAPSPISFLPTFQWRWQLPAGFVALERQKSLDVHDASDDLSLVA